MTEALRAYGTFHLVLGLAVSERIVVDVMRRPTDHHGIELVAELRLCPPLEFAHKAADQIEKGNDPALDADRFIGQGLAQHALE